MVASIGGFLDIAELLIINGADVNQKDLVWFSLSLH